MSRSAVISLTPSHHGTGVAAARRSAWSIAQEFLILFADRLGEMQERAAQRRQLASLEDRMLQDIGCDRAQALAEAVKPFWRP